MANPETIEPDPPLCVDLDGSLLQTDTLWESLAHMLRETPWALVRLVAPLVAGRSAFKTRLSDLVRLDVTRLPYDEELLTYLKAERASGRSLFLVTGAEQRIAEAVQQHVGLFSEVVGTVGSTNLTGVNKAAWLCRRFGDRGFDYLGDSKADLAVWAKSRRALVVARSIRLVEEAALHAPVERIFQRNTGSWRAWMRALRPHQWIKNSLVFVPLVTAHIYDRMDAWMATIGAFVALSCVASGTYLVNDLLDLEADRQHPNKRSRPFAAGAIQLWAGFTVFPLLLISGLAIGTAVPGRFGMVLLAYLASSLTYTLYLKQRPMADVMGLAALYTLRIFAGAEAINVEVSSWLLLFSIFLFLSLGMVKRFTEILLLADKSDKISSRRGYLAADLGLLGSLGPTCGYLAALIFVLYVNSSTVEALYRHGTLLWLECLLLLYWIGRVWLIAHRGGLHHDPVVFAIRDRASYMIAVIAFVIFLLARPK